MIKTKKSFEKEFKGMGTAIDPRYMYLLTALPEFRDTVEKM